MSEEVQFQEARFKHILIGNKMDNKQISYFNK